MSVVIVQLETAMSREELLRLMCDLWAVQATPSVVQISHYPTVQSMKDDSEVIKLCKDLVEIGLISLLVPDLPPPAPQWLTGGQIVAIARGEWHQIDSMMWPAVRLDSLPAIYEAARDRGKKYLDGG